MLPLTASGKFLQAGDTRFLVKGVSYGTFAPDAEGYQFPPIERVSTDFAMMARYGFNTVRVYTSPREDLLDAAWREGLRVIVGIPWAQHVAFLDDRTLCRNIRADVAAHARRLAAHPAVMLCAIGNEIPPSVIRWHGRRPVERFIRELFDEAKAAAPHGLFTYVNYPPTEYLDLSFLDVCAFNVYLHREGDLRAYIARLQHVADRQPLLLAEMGADSLRHGEDGQAELTAMQLRAAFAEGACGAIAFAWTDEWWRGGSAVEDWAFGLVDAARRPKQALGAVANVLADAPFPKAAQSSWPRVSVVICAYNAQATIGECLGSLTQLSYPDFEIIVVDDGSTDGTADIARGYPGVRIVATSNQGLSATRNVGLAEATGEIVAYTDADTRVEPDWLAYLVQPFLNSDVVGAGGPNIVPADDPWLAQCVARAPGGPIHVLLDDRIAEHVPGCNMAFRRNALMEVGGFNPLFLRAGDDVDLCWRIQARGWRIGFAPAAVVWHRHRATVRAYWRQQVGYGEGEAWLIPRHPDKFRGRHAIWRGRMYSPMPFIRSLAGLRVHTGVWGTSAFPSVYGVDVHPLVHLPHSISWQLVSVLLILGGAGVVLREPAAGLLLALLGSVGIGTTVVRCARFAWQSEVGSLGAIDGWSPRASRLIYRLTIAGLHLLQPLARWRGRRRARTVPPLAAAIGPEVCTAAGPSLVERVAGLRCALGIRRDDRFWSASWTSVEAVLGALVHDLRSLGQPRLIEIDDGWQKGGDVSVGIGRWAWIDVRALVEEHAAGRCLWRTALRLRPTLPGTIVFLVVPATVVTAVVGGLPFAWPFAVLGSFAASAALVGIAAWQVASTAARVRQAIHGVAGRAGMIRIPLGGSSAPADGVVASVRAACAPAMEVVKRLLARLSRNTARNVRASAATVPSFQMPAPSPQGTMLEQDAPTRDPSELFVRDVERPGAGYAYLSGDATAIGSEDHPELLYGPEPAGQARLRSASSQFADALPNATLRSQPERSGADHGINR